MALHRKSGVKNPAPEQAHYARDLPAVGGPHTALAKNLRASVIDPTAAKIAGHARTKVDRTAADGSIADQLRTVSDKPYPTAFGCRDRNNE
jgi:hypothetical protein